MRILGGSITSQRRCIWLAKDMRRARCRRGSQGQRRVDPAASGVRKWSSGCLVEHGADAAAQNRYGRIPLHRASERGHLDVARFLVERGADVAAQDKDESTPLHRASEGGHLDVARFLVEHGADALPRTNTGGLRCPFFASEKVTQVRYRCGPCGIGASNLTYQG